MWAALGLTLAFVFGTERPITPPAYGPAYGAQFIQTLASDGRDFLAVWTEDFPGQRGIYATVVSETMDVRSVPARAIVLREGIQIADAVWAGDAYLLSWSQDQHTVVARLSREGVLEGTPVPIAFQTGVRAMAWNGRHVLFVVARPDGTEAAMLVDPHGRVVRDDIVIPVRNDMHAVDVAAAGDVFVIAWSDARWDQETGITTTSIRTMRVSPAGEAFAPQDVVSDAAGHVGDVRMAGSGNEIGLAYVRAGVVPGETPTLVMQTIDAQIGAASPPVSKRLNAGWLQVVPTSGGFVAVLLHLDGDDLQLVKVPFSGGRSSPVAIGPAVSGLNLRVASNGNTIMALWQDHRLTPAESEAPKFQIFGAALDAAAERLTSDVTPIALSAVGQGRPVIAPAGDEALVLWTDLTRTSSGELRAVRVDASGNRIGDPVVLTSVERSASKAAAVFTGQVWLVAWSVVGPPETGHLSRLYTMRIARDGTRLDPAPVPLGPGSWPLLASNGRVTVLAFDGKLLRYSAAGERIDHEPLDTPVNGMATSIGTNGREFLLTWTSGDDWWQFPSPNRFDVQAIRLDASGAPMDAAPIDVATSPDSEWNAAVVSDGTDFLVVYQQGGNFDLNPTIRSKRVLRSGTLDGATAAQEGTPVAVGMAPIAAAPYRDGYLVTFTAGEPAFATIARIDRAGNARIVRAVVTTPDDLPGSAVASSGDNAWLAYVRAAPELQNVPRVFVRRVLEPVRRRAVR